MESHDLAVIGFGDLGERLSRRLQSPRWRCHGLRRNARRVPPGVRGLAVDLRKPETLSVLERIAPEALLVTLSPGERTEDGYRQGFDGAMAAILSGLGAHRPRHAFFVSSTRVYAETEGAWIDESSPLAIGDPFSRAIIDAEQRLLDTVPGAAVLRAGGLYGSGPGPLLKRVAAGRLSPPTPLRYGNRIHRDDVAGFVAHALEGDGVSGIINLVDSNPAPLQDVEAWLCEGLGRPYEPPPEDPGARSPSHKRIRNKRLTSSGYELQYADFKAGYAEVLHEWIAHSEREDGLDLH